MAQLAYIGIGSNLNDPAQQVKRAIGALGASPAGGLIACSSLYGSRPLGPPDQPDYVNAVVAMKTEHTPHQLLATLKSLEANLGREVMSRRWGPRLIDLDLLVFSDQVIEDGELVVPHPGIAARSFVLLPLLEIAPALVVPGLEPLAELLARCPPPPSARL